MPEAPGHLATRGDARRWGIEPIVSDLKTGGSGLEGSQTRHPGRLARRILVMAPALYFAVSTGQWDAAHHGGPACRPCAARGRHGRPRRYDPRRNREEGANQAPRLPAQVAAALPRGGRQAGGSRRPRRFAQRKRLACLPSSACPRVSGRSARTTNAIERLHGGFKRRVKTQAVLPSAETAATPFWALPASGQVTMREVTCAR